MDRSRDASAESIGQGEGQRLLHRKIVRPPGRISETKSALVGPDPLQESEGEGEMKARAENSGKLWTAQEDERLRELAVSNATPSEIAEKLNRTESATKARAYVLRVGLRRFRARRRDLSKWG